MKIGIISDTHGDYESFSDAKKYLDECDEILHAGDILSFYSKRVDFLSQELKKYKIHYVRGNNDDSYLGYELGINEELKEHKVIDYSKNNKKIKIFLTHGHRYMQENDMLGFAMQKDCNIIIHGHTHKKRMQKIKNIIIINPGSLSIPRDKTGSLAILDTQKEKIDIIEIQKDRIWDSIKI